MYYHAINRGSFDIALTPYLLDPVRIYIQDMYKTLPLQILTSLV